MNGTETTSKASQSSSWLIWAVLLAVLAGGYMYSNWPRPPAGPAAFTWTHDLDAAKKTAAAENKLVLIDFYATWCGPCQMMDREVWPREDVAAELNDWITVKIDGDRQRDVLRQYGVMGYPTFVVLKPNGEELARVSGGYRPDGFLKWIRSVESKWGG